MSSIGDIVPPYIRLRIEIAGIFRPAMERAEKAQDSPRLAELEALLHQVLEALPGGDTPRT